MPEKFDAVSFFIGLIIGVIIMIIIVWIAYASRTFVFTYCASNAPICTGNDYYNDPGQALANGAQLSDILFLNDQNEMFYKRVPATSSCVPGPGQTVEILYPQYCLFQIEGVPTEGRAPTLHNPVYVISGSTVTIDTSTTGSCIPNSGQAATSGVPELKWDATPL